MLGLILESAERYVPRPAKDLSTYLTLYVWSLWAVQTKSSLCLHAFLNKNEGDPQA